MAKVIIFKQKGDWKKSRKFLKRCSELDLDAILNQYGREGVEALAKATPKATCRFHPRRRASTGSSGRSSA